MCEWMGLATGRHVCPETATYVLYMDPCDRCVGHCAGVRLCIHHTAIARIQHGPDVARVEEVAA